VEAILSHCRCRVDRWVAEIGGVQDIAALEAVVAKQLHLVLEEVWSDDNLNDLIRKYTALKEGVFAYLKVDLDGTTFGATYRRSQVGADAPDRHVAIIDCRGEKDARRFFTRWHEIAHLLSLPGELEAPVRRSQRNPLERLMDEIAGHVGFYEPLFLPVFQGQMKGKRLLSFQVVEAVRQHGFPDASFQATLSACNRQLKTPVVYVEAALAHKAEDQGDINRGVRFLFDDSEPEAKLRAIEVVPNPTAQEAKVFIAPNMRIPESSVIHRLFLAENERELAGQENLNTWEHSGGKCLANQKVWVEARKVKDRVIAIVQPLPS
jgi:hypothetical protein